MKIYDKTVKILFLLIFIFSCAIAICNVYQPIIIKNLIDSAIDLEVNLLKKYSIIFAIVICFVLLFEYMRKYTLEKYNMKITNVVRDNILKGVLKKDLTKFFFLNNQEYISLFNNDVPSIINEYYLLVLDISFTIFSLIIYSFMLIKLNYIMALIVIITNILPILIPFILKKGLQDKKSKYLESLKEYNVKLGDVINGFLLIKSHCIEDTMREKVNKSSISSTKKRFNYKKITIFSEMLIGMLSFLSFFLLIIVGVFSILNNKMTVGSLFAAIQVSELMVVPIINISDQLNTYNSIKKVKNNLFAQYAYSNDLENKNTCSNDTTKIETLVIKNLNFKYDNKIALNNINLTFEKGKKYLIYGPSGSGKSTLFKILTKLYMNYSGDIMVNDIELKNISNIDYFSKIGIVYQKPYILNDGLKDNITLYKNYSEEQIQEIINNLYLSKIENDIILNKTYKDSEDNLSGGEKQKIALAQVLLENKEIIFLDEATSAIDINNSYHIEKKLLSSKHLTLINIEHKVNKTLIKYYDSVICISDGMITDIITDEEGKEKFISEL